MGESWHWGAGVWLQPPSPWGDVAFTLWAVEFFSVLPPAALDAFSPTVEELGQHFISHPYASNLGLNKEEQSEKPLGKALFWSPSPALPGLGDTHVDHKTLLVPKSQFSPSSFCDNPCSDPMGRFYYFTPKVWFPPCISVSGMCHIWLKVELSLPEQLKFGLTPPWSTLQLAELIADMIFGCSFLGIFFFKSRLKTKTIFTR